MNKFFDSESGFIGEPEGEFGVNTGMTDVEILYVSKINIIARGRRFGRRWLLKGLIEQRRNSPVDRRRLQKEFEIHSRLLNPGVVQAVSFEEVENLGLCIVEEWIEGQTLAQLLQEGMLSKKERQRIMYEIIRSVAYIHSKGVVHRDLKPSNIMIRNTGGGVAIIDFGLADTDDYAELKQCAGTEGYISPEQRHEGGSKITDDIYSLGVIMQQLYPEYSSIAAKCIGPIENRPKNAIKLMKSIERHDRIPKIIGSMSGVAVLIALVVLTGLHINSLKAATQEAHEKVSALSETNHQHEKRVAELTDSLTGMTDRVAKAEGEIKRVDSYNEARKQAYLVACNKIDKTLKNFDKRVFPMFSKPEVAFYDSINNLHKRLQFICDNAYDPKNFPELQEDDKYKLQDEARGHYLTKFSSYYTLWQAKLYSDEVRENGVPENWPPRHVKDKDPEGMERVREQSLEEAKKELQK